MPRQRSSAVLLAASFALLIVYASLYPFTGWHWPAGQSLWTAMALPWPPWRDRFDLVANLLGYLPLGALLFGAVVRSGGGAAVAIALACLGPAALSFGLEVAQTFVPSRVPSRIDLALNASGAALGALLAALLVAAGFLQRWQRLRERWFVRRSDGALALLMLWPLGLLFPSPLPLGLGQVWDELRALGEAALEGSAWTEPAAQWFAHGVPAFEPLSPLAEALTIMLGLLAPCFVAFAATRAVRHRMLLAVGAALLALATSTLSASLNFGPEHALAWLTPATLPALGGALLVALLCSRAPQRLAAALGLMTLTGLVALVAHAPADPYFAASLQGWEQGRFIRFFGLAQWVGWLWPYLAMLWLLARVASSDDEPAAA